MIERPKQMWICSNCGRMYGWWVEECFCRSARRTVDRRHIAVGYAKGYQKKRENLWDLENSHGHL